MEERVRKRKDKQDKSFNKKQRLESSNKESIADAHSDSSSVGRSYTVSIALPGSIIANAQNLQSKTSLVGQIGRALAVFNVDEVVVFNESEPNVRTHDPNAFLCKLLQFLDTPQYLRKTLFPMQDDLKYAGLLNPIDAPHHLRKDEESTFREGVALDLPSKKISKNSQGSFVDCGIEKKVLVDQVIPSSTRVTVKLDHNSKLVGKYMTGTIVPRCTPRVCEGVYWGYTVRPADSFSDIFTKSPFKGGYDLTIGTSERGTNIDALNEIPKFQHLLIVFGGVNGLEYSLEGDESLMVNNVSLLFDYYLNTCPKQGSRTIRTEEAILISLAALRPLIES